MAFLEMRNIVKRFGSLTAVDNVDLFVEKGQIHALLGENGAGKSTLMNVLYGAYAHNSGTIMLDGQALALRDSKDAIQHGIGMVHQHFMLIPELTVIENVLLIQKHKKEFLDYKKSGEAFAAFAQQYGMHVEPQVKTETLTVGQQQRLEILKALYAGAKLLILDEPTAVLTPQEVDKLFEMLRQLIAKGLTIIFITHKLNEVMAVADQCTILRQGKLIQSLPISQVENPQQLATLMVGHEVDMVTKKADILPKAEVLRVEGLTYVDERKVKRLDHISFSIREGEILGICGVDGNGQSELVRCMTGLLPYQEGQIWISGEDCSHKSTKELLKKQIAHIPEDRHKYGMVGELSINENLILMSYDKRPYSRHGFINWKWVRAHNLELCEKYDVRMPGIETPAKQLSGGNQQKFVVGRELDRSPKLLIAMHPDRGLDINATQYIQSRIVEARDQDTAVLLVSTELEEILALSDRILVIYEGRVMGIFNQHEVTREQLGLLMAGVETRKNDIPC